MDRQGNQNPYQKIQQAQDKINQKMAQLNQQMQLKGQMMSEKFRQSQQKMMNKFQQMNQNQQNLNSQLQNQFTDMDYSTQQQYLINDYGQDQIYPPYQDYSTNYYQNPHDPQQYYQDNNQNSHFSKSSNDDSSIKKKHNSKIDEQETKQLLDDIFDQDQEKVQISMLYQDELASSLRKGNNSSIKSQLKHQYKDQLEFIKKNGFNCTIKILLLLQEENGNEDIVLRKLILQSLQKQSLKIKYESEIKNLQKQNKIKRSKKQILRYLKEANGDLNKTQQFIELDQQSRLQEQQLYKSQLQILALEGWLNSATKKTILKILSKNEGKVDKSRSEIQLRCYHRIKQLTQSEARKLNNFNCSEHFNENITDIVIDGNNLLFMNNSIRKNCINKQRSIAEKKICKLAKNLKEMLEIKILIVIFDQMYENICDSKIQVINCKNTQFKSSDDFIVDHVACLQNEQAKKTLIVTSDQELTFRLISTNQNVSIMKGKVYFQKIEELLSSEIFNQIVNDNEL